jgi:hypothetical protein
LAALLILMLVCGTIVFVWLNSSQQRADGARLRREWRRSTKEQLGLNELAYGSTTLGSSTDRRALAVIRASGEGEWIPFDAVAGVELTPFYARIDEGTSETTTRRGPQLIGAGLGAVVAGPAGMIVGGLSGVTRTESFSSSSEFLSDLELKVRLFSDDKPLLKVRFSVSELIQFDPETQRLEGSSDDIDQITARLATEVQCREAVQPANKRVYSFEKLSVPPPPPVPKGWWQKTFG